MIVIDFVKFTTTLITEECTYSFSVGGKNFGQKKTIICHVYLVYKMHSRLFWTLVVLLLSHNFVKCGECVCVYYRVCGRVSLCFCVFDVCFHFRYGSVKICVVCIVFWMGVSMVKKKPKNKIEKMYPNFPFNVYKLYHILAIFSTLRDLRTCGWLAWRNLIMSIQFICNIRVLWIAQVTELIKSSFIVFSPCLFPVNDERLIETVFGNLGDYNGQGNWAQTQNG